MPFSVQHQTKNCHVTFACKKTSDTFWTWLMLETHQMSCQWKVEEWYVFFKAIKIMATLGHEMSVWICSLQLNLGTSTASSWHIFVIPKPREKKQKTKPFSTQSGEKSNWLIYRGVFLLYFFPSASSVSAPACSCVLSMEKENSHKEAKQTNSNNEQ